VALAILLLGCYSSIASGASGSGTQPNHGFVAYQISLTKAGNPVEVFVVNETGQPTDQNDLVQLTFALTSGKRHLTYSKVVNSSSLPEIFPYFPELNNQSLSYSSHGIKLSAQISRSGTAQVTFKGQTYTAVKHALSISVSRTNGETYSAAGNILTMPSGLVYSVELALCPRRYACSDESPVNKSIRDHYNVRLRPGWSRPSWSRRSRGPIGLRTRQSKDCHKKHIVHSR